MKDINRRQKSGAILIAMLWIVVILTILAVSLGQAARTEIALTQRAAGKLKAKYYAFAGLTYAIEQIRLDSLDPASNQEDTLYYCGILKNSNHSSEDLFHEKPIGDGYFSIGNPTGSGFEDEERRLNINALSVQNSNVFIALLELLSVNTESAEEIVFSMLDWKDSDDVLADSIYGAENDYYLSLSRPYRCKDSSFDSLEELLLVRGMTPEIFTKIAPYLTIFPKQGFLAVNFNTASQEVLCALARGVVGSMTNTNLADADSLVAKILDYRRGEDGVELSADDRSVDVNDLSLNANERAILLTLNQYRTLKSDYFRVNTQGVAGFNKVKVNLEAIIERASASIVALRAD